MPLVSDLIIERLSTGDYYTAREMAETVGCNRGHARLVLARLVEDGLALKSGFYRQGQRGPMATLYTGTED